ncbi:hypothetical protein GCM10019059_43520 [Camelimonas fluminis]|nr:hypothetical protein GCM10019059_43520 [Camelimonas fluminis]
MAVDDPGDHVGEVAERSDVIEPAGFDERSDDGPMLRAIVTADNEGVLTL